MCNALNFCSNQYFKFEITRANNKKTKYCCNKGNEMKKRVCYVCKKETTDLCKRCKSTYYCSKSCQKSNWKHHKTECIDRKSLESQLQEYHKNAQKLFAICASECDGVPYPKLWICYQNEMRELWDEWNNNSQNINGSLFQCTSPADTCNACKDYMNYMYTTYPPGFGESLKNAVRNAKEGEIIDGCKIFNQLMKNV